MQFRQLFTRRAQRALVLICCFCLIVTPVAGLAQEVTKPAPDNRVRQANYEQASRWTAAKVGKMVFDTTVTPHWLESGDRFWYSYETNQGKKWWLVDPLKKSKTPLFDNAKLAALLTNLTRIPYDAQHLPIQTIKFIKHDSAFQFDANVPREAEIPGLKKEETSVAGRAEPGRPAQTGTQQQTQRATPTPTPAARTRPIYFEYELASGKLSLLPDFKPPQKPRWAALSPDEQTVIFARGHNLFTMDAANYAKAKAKEDDATVVETQLTTDGEENFGYERRLNEEEKRNYKFSDKNKTPRVPALTVYWSKDAKKFALQRNDQRKVADLWVINALANPRPTLETYRYGMPGEEHQPQAVLEVFEPATKGRVKLKTDRFKDQQIGVYTAPVSNAERERARTFQVDRGEQGEQQQQGAPTGGGGIEPQMVKRHLGQTLLQPHQPRPEKN